MRILGEIKRKIMDVNESLAESKRGKVKKKMWKDPRGN